MSARIVTVILCVAASTWQLSGQAGAGQEYTELASRLAAQEAQLNALQQQISQPVALVSEMGQGKSCDCCAQRIRRLPVVVAQPVSVGKSDGEASSEFTLHYYCDYDNGFTISPINPATHPFKLKTNGWIQFRHVGFARDVESWTDNAGRTRPVANRNKFDVERARLVFSGFALSEDLTYFLQLDGDGDGRDVVDFFDYWWGYAICDCLKIQVGKRKVPGSRQWLLGARRTRFIDRPMANDFFRPDRTVGVFAVGTLGETFHYEAMVGNGLRTANLNAAAHNNKLAYAATVYVDPWGDFGGNLVDFGRSEHLLGRFGASFSHAAQSGLSNGVPVAESNFAQLTDGTILTSLGALAGGVTVSQFDASLLSVDAAVKWRGWSANAEAFFRWLQAIRGDGPLPLSDLHQRGFYVEGGKFLVPSKLEVNARYSQIDGLFGHAEEVAGGLTWYPMDTHKMKVSFDVADITRGPLNNTASEILAGDDGLLFRSQFQVEF